jgi:hypothetical protein
LVAIGLPVVNANITNTVALCPGYWGGVEPAWPCAAAARMPWLASVAAVGG